MRSKQPYGEWLDSNLVQLKRYYRFQMKECEEYTEEAAIPSAEGVSDIPTSSIATFYSEIWHKMVQRALAAMGVDTPLAVLSKQNRPLV